MTVHGWIMAAGLYDIGFALFHALFPLLFRWGKRLGKLDPVNRAILRTLNIMLTLVFMAYGASLVLQPALVAANEAGRAYLFAGAGFWLVRAALQPALFGLGPWPSKLTFLVFLAGVVVHAVPAWPGLV